MRIIHTFCVIFQRDVHSYFILWYFECICVCASTAEPKFSSLLSDVLEQISLHHLYSTSVSFFCFAYSLSQVLFIFRLVSQFLKADYLTSYLFFLLIIQKSDSLNKLQYFGFIGIDFCTNILSFKFKEGYSFFNWRDFLLMSMKLFQ